MKKKVSLAQKLYRKLTEVSWQIAFVEHSNPILLSKEFRKVIFQDGDNSWYADPFILSVDGNNILVLSEEYLCDKKKGIITLLEIDRNSFIVKNKKRILELETHLSFPFFVKSPDGIYIFPENSAAGAVTSYKLKDNYELERVAVVCDDALTDIAILFLDGSYYLFGTMLPYENSGMLRVYKSNDLNGHYELVQELELAKNSARGASGIYPTSNSYVYLRFAQDNLTLYGRGLICQQLTFDKTHKTFKVNELYRKYPDFTDKSIIAMHTYNYEGGIAVIDIKNYMRPFWGKLVNGIRYKLL